MPYRITAWLSAGVLAAGVSTAALAGAAVAAADEGADAGTPKSSQTASETPSRTSSDATVTPRKERSGTVRTGPSPDPASEPADGPVSDDEAHPPADSDDADDTGDTEVAGDDVASGDLDDDAVVDEQTEDVVDERTEDLAEEAVDRIQAPEAGSAEEQVPTADEPAPAADLAEAATTSETQTSTTTVQPATTAVDDEKPVRLPSLLNVVGSFFWGLFDLVTKLVDVPPAVPPGSTLTAGRSKLEIECGDGYTADADWYFPTAGDPEKFIYFQHGFPARAGFYNVTLQQLAERNNAVVVAPSITSNIFACDACAASGEPMHVAVARLFEGDRAALLASARAAGYEGTLPEEFVFAGQSAGASLAIAAAGFYYESAADAEKDDMVGVLLYDVSAIGGAAEGNALTNGLRKLPASVPVLNVAAEPNMLNSQSSANAVFVAERPGQFNGVQLVGGAHSDAFRSDILFGIPQLIVNIAFGASTPENAAAVHVLTTGWLTDMYAGRVYDPQTRTGIYGVPGEPSEVVVDIPTSKGLASAYVLPVQTPTPNLFDRVVNFFFGFINANYYARCVVASDEAAAASAAVPQSCRL